MVVLYILFETSKDKKILIQKVNFELRFYFFLVYVSNYDTTGSKLASNVRLPKIASKSSLKITSFSINISAN